MKGKTKTLVLLFLFSLSFYLYPFAFNLGADDWQELKGDHFIIFHANNEKFSKEVLSASEKYYKKIAEDLGYARYSNFWQWDNRVKIYIYPTEADYLKATGEPAWSKGLAKYDEKEIITFAWNEEFTNALLPHELTHLIFRDFIGFQGEAPLWLDEGVAQWEEPAKRAIAQDVARYLLESGKAFTIRALTSMDIRGSKDEEKVKYFYMQSVTLIDFLVARYGASSFTEFCRQLRDGKSLEEALTFAYPTSIRSLDDLEKQWMKYVLRK